MQRLSWSGLSLAIAALAAAGCGDGARVCGAGTEDNDGTCVPIANTVCGDGTKLDNSQCVIDPASCEAGTVLIGNRCLDPNRGLVIDLEESVEPNGLGIATGVEASAEPAGTIALKPEGMPFVVHGHLTPFRNTDSDGQLDPDFDTYVITVAAATLLEISVDGTGGAQGAFYAVGAPDSPVPDYERYGLNLTGDTAKRQLFLPIAGRYELAITDTRSVAVGNNPPRPAGRGGAAGGPDAEYYATITARPIPALSSIPLSGGNVRQSGTLATSEVRFFTSKLMPGQNDIRVEMPGAAAASLIVLDAALLLEGYAVESATTPAAISVMVPVAEPNDTLMFVDAVYNYGPAPEPFTLTTVLHGP
jgi:hypothetical protein